MIYIYDMIRDHVLRNCSYVQYSWPIHRALFIYEPKNDFSQTFTRVSITVWTHGEMFSIS